MQKTSRANGSAKSAEDVNTFHQREQASSSDRRESNGKMSTDITAPGVTAPEYQNSPILANIYIYYKKSTH